MQEKESIMVVRCELKIPSLGISVRQHSASLVMPNSYFSMISQRLKSLLNHSVKVMLKIISNRLQPQAEKVTAEEQAAGFTVGRSTTKQICSYAISGSSARNYSVR